MKKVLYFVFALSIIIWLGGSIIRNTALFDIFEQGIELSYKNYYSDEKIDYNIYLFISTSIYTNIAYGLALISCIMIMILERKNIKDNGWLFMSILVFLLFSPIVLYNIYLDFTISRALFYDDFSFLTTDIRTSIFDRYKSNSNKLLSGISYLTSMTIVAYAIWRPLTKNSIDS